MKKISLLISFCLLASIALAETASVIPIDGEINPYRLAFLQRAITASKDADLLVFEINTYGGLVDSALKITTLIGSLKDTRTVAYIPAASGSIGVSWSAGALIAFSCDSIVMGPGTSLGAAAPVYQGTDGMTMAPEKTVSAVRTQMASLAEKNGYPKALAIAMVDADAVVKEVFLRGERLILLQEDIELLIQDEGEEAVKVGKTLSAEGKLLTLTAKEMEIYGISQATITDYEDIWHAFSLTDVVITRHEENPSDQIIAFITSAGVTSILLMIGLAALYIEVTSPGFGVPGTIALICFTIIFGASGLLGNLGSAEILLFLLGAVLLLVEVFLIPGFGITGISGLALIAAALILSRQSFILPEFDWEWEELQVNFFVVLGGLLGAGILIGLFMLFFPQVARFTRLVLKTEQKISEGYSSHDTEGFSELIGRAGESLTILRPTGTALISGKRYTVMTQGEFIPAKTEIKVVDCKGSHIFVEKETQNG